MQKSKEDNSQRKIEIDKLVINCCVGEPGDKLTKAVKVLKDLSGQEPVMKAIRITIRSFGVRRGQQIACHVTIRGEKALDLLERGIKVKEYELRNGCFTDSGCFGFGIDEHIDLGLRYDPYTGIYGMDFYVVLKRKGFRVKLRKHKRGKVGNFQKISKEEAMEWFKTKFDAAVL